MPHLLFVYGTLLRGERNHHYLASARFMGEAATEPGFALYDFGAYPALSEPGEHEVAGELYEIDEDTLARVDELEEHPDYYQRRELTLCCGTRAITYVLPHRFVEQEGGVLLASGSWRKR